MPVADRPHSPTASLRARLRRIATGLVATLVVLWGGSLLLRTQVLGSSHQDLRAAVEQSVRAAIARDIDAAHAHAVTVAALTSVRRADESDGTGLRTLFDDLAALVGRTPGTAATTVFSTDGTTLGWAGRPSDVPTDRVRSSREDWFIVEGALGLRLVHLWPAGGGSRSVIATERDIGTAPPPALAGVGAGDRGRYQMRTRWGSVGLEVSSRLARTTADASRFDVNAPGQRPLVTAVVEAADLERALSRWTGAARWAALLLVALAVAAGVGALLDWRHAHTGPGWWSTVVLLAAPAIARGLLLIEPPGNWSSLDAVTGVAYGSSAVPRLLASPVDFALTALCGTAWCLVALRAVEVLRRTYRGRRPVDSGSRRLWHVAGALVAGVCAAVLLRGYGWLLADTIASSTLDLLHLSVAPLSASRMALQLGLVVAHAGVACALVAIFRLSTVPWLAGRQGAVGLATAWALPTMVWFVRAAPADRDAVSLVALGVAMLGSLCASSVWARYRNGSQAFRLVALAVGVMLPALAFYPTIFALAWRAKSDLVETRYAPQAMEQRRTVYALLEQSLREIDQVPGLVGLVAASDTSDTTQPPTDRSFQLWQATALARYPVTSSVEVYGTDGALRSRFAFNLPEDLSAAPTSDERSCDWTLAEEVAPFFAEERRVYHAGRAICDGPDGAPLGSIVVHALLDYENLPFTAPRTPYVQLLLPGDTRRGPDAPADDLEYAVYGWSRTPLYASRDTAWPLDDAVFSLVEQSRDPVWATLRRGGEPFDVYLQNDRGGIYALGFPAVSTFGHLLNVAELATLGAITFLVMAAATALFTQATRRVAPARSLLRDVRASFYRKLFLAFVAAVVAPVALLAVVARTFVATEMRAGVEREALRTSGAASRIVADLIAPQAALQGSSVDDNLMVWVSRLINEDANIFTGTGLQATSQRTVFASGLLSTRTPAEVYRALSIRREAGAVARDRIGDFEYVVAASPIRLGSLDAVMTVPLTARQRDIDLQIEALDRRVLLAALAFMLVGAGLGYTMAERIADPVNRLTRATRRLAGGDFDVRVASTSSDELARLVGDFNKMATELQRQRGELERTNRLEAWAEMARQVAHDIKNPLTPIQLNAEHLRRVHADKGEPLGTIVRDCVDAILSQVTLLRQISSEFSNFASSPSVRRAAVDTAELVTELIEPYRRGTPQGIAITVGPLEGLPPVLVDRGLVVRSLTNIVENALHAMPSGGRLGVETRVHGDVVAIAVSDTGAGMDPEALERAFEPYFSTKARGTGLGLPIAKRNVELSGGSIAITSRRDQGTTVEVRLPLAPRAT